MQPLLTKCLITFWHILIMSLSIITFEPFFTSAYCIGIEIILLGVRCWHVDSGCGWKRWDLRCLLRYTREYSNVETGRERCCQLMSVSMRKWFGSFLRGKSQRMAKWELSEETLQRLSVQHETVLGGRRIGWTLSISASMPMSLVLRTENDHHVPFDCH